MFTFKSRVRYSEVGKDGKMTLESIMNYFQDCATFHSEEVGFGVKYLMEQKRGWVLLSWQITVERYPEFGEKITISTKAYDFKRSFGYRNLMLQDAKGNYVAYANSVWLYMDLERLVPDRVNPEQVEAYTLEEKFPMSYGPAKIKLPQVEAEEKEPIVIGSYQIDTNGHVNNVEYVRMAVQALGMTQPVRHLRAEYKKQALVADVVHPIIYREEGCDTVSLNQPDGKPYAIIELRA